MITRFRLETTGESRSDCLHDLLYAAYEIIKMMQSVPSEWETTQEVVVFNRRTKMYEGRIVKKHQDFKEAFSE